MHHKIIYIYVQLDVTYCSYFIWYISTCFGRSLPIFRRYYTARSAVMVKESVRYGVRWFGVVGLFMALSECIP
jgi:hypothetical protein